MKPLRCLLILVPALFLLSFRTKANVIWQIGNADHKPTGMALAPAGYKDFLAHDFGWEDRFYMIGFSRPEKDWPYVLPGPDDVWSGTGPTSGIRSQVLNILFGIESLPPDSQFKLLMSLVDINKEHPPLFKVTINGKSWEYQLPPGGSDSSLTGNYQNAREHVMEIPVDKGLVRVGGNEIQLTTLAGSWVVFDQVRLEGPGLTMLEKPGKMFVRDVQAANYETSVDGKQTQPLLVDVQHLEGTPHLQVTLDGKAIFDKTIESERYRFEAPMPAVTETRQSQYRILSDGNELRSGSVTRSPQPRATPVDYVDTEIGSAHSRWMIAPGPWMPFSMVKLSPDNQDNGWQAGYDPTFESIGAFSHIHEWTMAGLGMLPVNGPLKIQVGDQNHPDAGYRSRIDKSTEEAPLGYYKVMLTDYHIKAELTATTRCGFQRYTYPRATDSRVMIDLQIPSEYAYQLQEVEIRKVSDHRLEGFSKQHAPNVWSGGVDQDYTVHFVIEFDQPIVKFGTWANDSVDNNRNTLHAVNVKDAGAFVEFDTRNNPVVQVRSGISLVSVENAAKNLEQEISIPFQWDFDAVRNQQRDVWNNLLQRAAITSDDQREKMRFYTNMYRALCSRNTWSDVDGRWVDATETVRQLTDPNARALGCDAFWNTFWNLNQFWNLLTPEWSSRWVHSQLAMYDANGWLAKGPAGMEYIPVMVAEHEIPLLVGAYQMGIRDYDAEKMFEAVHKMQTTPPQKVGNGLAGNRDLQPYLQYHFVPYDKGRFSNTLEYSYDDWTVGQLAKALGKTQEYQVFKDRSTWWKNAIDKETGYARMRKSDGTWFPDFDAFQSGRNEQYVEGNAWQLTYFVPQNIPALVETIGKDRFLQRLEWGFGVSNQWRFNAPNDQYWDYPVMQGNQQSMHFDFLFNWAGKPWLTQKWSRAIMERYYGYGTANAYLGDEDQGQMSAWFVMNALGLFQTDGGCRVDPIYEIGSPIFEKTVLELGGKYGRGETFVIEAPNVSRTNKYVQKATLNGKALNSCWFPASELLKGGKLVLEMGPKSNMAWGVENPPRVAD